MFVYSFRSPKHWSAVLQIDALVAPMNSPGKVSNSKQKEKLTTKEVQHLKMSARNNAINNSSAPLYSDEPKFPFFILIDFN